ncbi:hypothetical protein [Microseira wollei]|uniref:Peptidoglycan binding domain-containing protein n=1 Tax=Microseira wollei NIES-4236 TaxID=2530354 RepID=A0AAV3X6N4_9CYAN|nr:hypothetical protein [Microseira wollei]GET37988.1 peptidoglycan binding domain-containing protein [Microseira wollei NIES-4236]
MENLAYLHCASAYDEAPPIELVPGEDLEPLFNELNWNKFSSKALVGLMPFAVVVGLLGTPQQAQAGYHCGHVVSVSCKYKTVSYHKKVVYHAKYIPVVYKKVVYKPKYITVVHRKVIPAYKYVKVVHPVVIHKAKLVKTYYPIVIRKPKYYAYKTVSYKGCCKHVVIHKSKCFYKKVIYRPAYHYKHYSFVVHRAKFIKVYHPIVVHKVKHITVFHPVVFHKVKYIKVLHPVVFYKPKYHYYHVVHRPSPCKRYKLVHRPKYYSHYYDG